MVSVRHENGVLAPCAIHDGVECETLFQVRLRRDEILERWPAQSAVGSAPLSTAAKESACRAWLRHLMRQNPANPRPKTAMRADAQEMFPGLGRNAFDRAWTRAIGVFSFNQKIG